MSGVWVGGLREFCVCKLRVVMTDDIDTYLNKQFD
jgi:hypothetical protein